MWISEPKTKKAKKGQVDFESSYPNYLVLMCFIACNIRIPYDVISGSFPVVIHGVMSEVSTTYGRDTSTD